MSPTRRFAREKIVVRGIETASTVSVPAVVAWGCCTTAWLGLACGGFRAWAHHPYPPEVLAVQMVAIGQIVVGTCLAAVLFPNPATAAVQACISLITIASAKLIGTLPIVATIEIIAAITVWMLGLACCLRQCSNFRVKFLVNCVFVIALLLPVILQYLAGEAGLNSDRSMFTSTGVVEFLARPADGRLSLLWAASPLFAAGVVWTIKRSKKWPAPPPFYSTIP